MKVIKKLMICVLILSMVLGNVAMASAGNETQTIIQEEKVTEGAASNSTEETVEEAMTEVAESEEAVNEPEGLIENAADEAQMDEAQMDEVAQPEEPQPEDKSASDAKGNVDTKGSDEEEHASEPISDVYYEWQTLEEILELCDQGLDLTDFFQYSIWGFLTREDIEALVENGHTLDDVYEAIETANFDVPEDILAVLNTYTSLPMTMALGDTKVAGFKGSVSSTLGTIPAFGDGSHGPMLQIHLSGETAFCAKFGAACRTGMVYTSVPLDEIGISGDTVRILRGLMAHYAEAQSIYTGSTNYVMIQAGVWLALNGQWTGNPAQMAVAISPLFSKTTDCPDAAFAESYFEAIVKWIDAPENASKIEAIGLEGWANGPNQYLVTATGEGGPIETIGGYARIELTKTDSETGNIIADDAKFTLYEWNGSSYEESSVEVYRDGNKYTSDDIFWSETNEGKFYLEETKAPHTGSKTGYYGDFKGSSKRTYKFEVTEDMEGEIIEITNSGDSFENDRTTGSIKVTKVDIEADAYVTGEVSHGIAELDGAIYDLFAAADIIHPDGVTGVIYKKDELVASATIKDGACEYTNLYLGSYYVKERQKGETLSDGKKLSFASGYLLDEMIYYVTLPYEGEEVKNVHRDVKSDKEQVIKAKAVIEKVESSTGQGNINYLEGAGFTIYRIDKLSKADSFIKRADGTFDETSIQEAYLVANYNEDTPKYDFSKEEAAIATTYIRNTDMREDTAFYWKDGLSDIKAGKLISLGNHYYQVAELFTDANGQIVTPYLPYGQYLVVETTVPKDHFQAPPFILTFNKGKTTSVITTGVTEDTPYGKNVLKSSGDAVESCEAVYFTKVIDNEVVEELLKIYKKDTDTGKTVLLADTKFKIAKIDEKTGNKTYLTHTSYYPQTVNTDVFRTNAKGYLQLPELLAVGTYQIEEIDGPNGFYNDIPAGYVKFKVTTDREYVSLLGDGSDGSTLEGDYGKRDILLIIEDYYNRETRGELTIRKQGEVLTGFENTSILQDIKELFGMDAKKNFVYKTLPIAGAEYTIRAAEDIVTQDRQVDENGNRTLWFAKGDVIAVVTTGEEGQIDNVKVATESYPDGHPIVTVLHDGTLGSVKVYVPLGTYEVEETKAPYGYTRTLEKPKVTFTWEHQFQEFVFNSAPIEQTEEIEYRESDGSLIVTNARVKAVPKEDTIIPGIGIYKRAKESDIPLSGVVFGLYAKDDIFTRDGVKIVEAGTLLSTCQTKEDGKTVFDIDVPIRDEFFGSEEMTNSGEYLIKELETPSGILLDDTPIPVLFTYVDDKTEYVVIAKEQQNQTTEVYVSKQDLTTSKELKDATLTVTEDWSGDEVHSWVSDGTNKEIRGLAVNETLEDDSYTYTLKETSAPDGYLVAESIRFKLVLEEAEDGSLSNTVYVYDKETKTWVLATDNLVVMKDQRKPVKPKKPDKPGKPDEPAPAPTPTPISIIVPKTGDDSHIGLYAGLMVAGSALLTGAALWLKRRGKKEKEQEGIADDEA